MHKERERDHILHMWIKDEIQTIEDLDNDEKINFHIGSVIEMVRVTKKRQKTIEEL